METRKSCFLLCGAILALHVLFSLPLSANGTHVYCRATYKAEDNMRPSVYLKILNGTGQPCTYLDGNLILMTLAGDKTLLDPNLQLLLNKIQVITGYVRIYLRSDNVRDVSLNSLQIILGKYQLYPSDGKDYSLHFAVLESVERFNFPNLKAIENGHVGFSTAICDLVQRVAWDEIFRDPETQTVAYVGDKCSLEQIQKPPNCASSCPVIKGFQRCWGPDVNQCQERTRCQNRQGKYCYYTAANEEELCAEECIGGCSGAGLDNCFSCAGYQLNNTCVPSCPPNNYILGRLCVTECPDKTVIDNNACVNQCPDGFMTQNGSRVCEQCPPGGCNILECQLLDPDTNYHSVLNGVNLAKLTNCTTLVGSIRLSAMSFHGPNGIRSTTELEALSNLQIVTGVVFLDLSNRHKGKSLDFLRNLRVIKGEYRAKTTTSIVLFVANSEIEYLGFQSLESLPPLNVHFQNLTALRYGKNVNWKGLGATNLTERPPSPEQKPCDPQCDPAWGCQGPGPTMCVRCVNWRASDWLCVTNCSDQLGHFTPRAGKESPELISKKKCALCNSQCAANCDGPGPGDCLGKCKNYAFENTCVAECPPATYLIDSQDRVCKSCSPACHRREITKKPVCSGPLDSDCHKCTVLLINVTATPPAYCRRVLREYCPPSYYRVVTSHEKPTVLPSGLPPVSVSTFVEEEDKMEICLPCAPACTSCTSLTQCQECAGAWFRGECVAKCPLEWVASKYHNVTIPANGTCSACDINCKDGCSDLGPTNCRACATFSVLLDPKNDPSKVECVHQCPVNTFANEYGHCVAWADTPAGRQRKVVVAVVASSVPILVLLMIVVLLCAFLAWKRKKELARERQKIHDVFCNAYENPDAVGAALDNREINLSRLEFIQTDELLMNEAERLGSGAFGEVFKAEWRITEEKLQRRLSEYGGRKSAIASPTSSLFMRSSLRPGTQQRHHLIDVAVKKLTALSDKAAGAATRDEVFAEARVMASVKHPNCLPLIGLCMSEGYLITAYMAKGSLDRYLQVHRDSLDAHLMFLWCQQIADGMNYLTRQGIIHRDLAARNVLLKDHDWAMITDFGLSKMLENESQREVVILAGRVPIRWLAVETLRHGIYSSATDVWSFGVTVWEIFTFADMPYSEIENTIKVRDYVLGGNRLDQPTGMHNLVYLELLKCWSEDPEGRPNFNLLKMKFKAFGDRADEHFNSPFIQTNVPLGSPVIRDGDRGSAYSKKPEASTSAETSQQKVEEKLKAMESGYEPAVSSTGYTDMSQALSFDGSSPTSPAPLASDPLIPPTKSRYENVKAQGDNNLEMEVRQPLMPRKVDQYAKPKKLKGNDLQV